jgi:pimeloyl-ACP methyl ester carboxylesterase
MQRDSRRRTGALTTKIQQVVPLARPLPVARICAAMPSPAPLVSVAAWLALAAVPAIAVAQADGWLGEGRCRLAADSLPAAYAHCGMLDVPLDPAAPDGPTIAIFVARLGGFSPEPRPDPLLLISGGPGQSTVDFYLQLRGAFELARRDRDIILVDQRGTGRSAEGFACEVPDDLSLDTAGPDELNRVIDACVAELDHDPRFYTTSVAVQDLERVRAALGIEQWNVYGVSYGTRVAQHYLRRFPERVRSVVLDGVVPPPLALGPDVAREAQRALEQIFARCAAEPQCGARFAALPQLFGEVLARLDAGVADETDPPPISALELRTLVRFMSYSAATVALLPVLISEAHAGNYAPLAGQARTLLRELPESLSFPMSNSVMCAEDAPFVTATATGGLEATYLGTGIMDGIALICGRWPVGPVDADLKTAVVSDTPVLLLSGEYDPITPPAYAERVKAEGLSNSVHVIGRGQGHGLVGIGCVPRLLRSFLEQPDPALLDASCLLREPPTPFFLSLLGPSP